MQNMLKGLAAIVLAGFALAGCQAATSNNQTLITNDCGREWRLIEVGQSIPQRVGPCAYFITVPNYPLQGGYDFIATFKNRVRVGASASYDYEIVDPLKFIAAARYLGRRNSTADGSDNSATNYESAENSLIDRQIREIATNLLKDEDVVDYEQGPFEDALLTSLNEGLAERGVHLNSLAFIITPDDQTRGAIDVASAMRVYESVHVDANVARQIIIARAGAPQIAVTTQAATPHQN